MEKKKSCFVIMPISDAEGYDKGHFNRVYEHLIKPACEQAGFEAIRADDTSKSNMIMVDILQKILECDMAICDLSSRNPNVFYELGFRQAFNKKTVLIKDTRTPMPFDISSIRTLPYNESLRIDEVNKTVPEIAKYITDTSKTDNKDINSLLQLLSIEKPAALPDKIDLSQESNMILNSIRRLEAKLSSRGYATSSINLPNGENALLGCEIFNEKGDSLGTLMGEDEDSLFIESTNGGFMKIDKNGKLGKTLSMFPF